MDVLTRYPCSSKVALPTVDGTSRSNTSFSMDSAEMSIHIRGLLINWGYDRTKAAGYSSHSMKATLLSWCAKAGIAFEVRRMLGYHARPGDKSVVVYSRDAMAEPLRHLALVLRLVQLKEFDPDRTRSGCWPKAPDEETQSGDSSEPWRA